MKTGDSFGGHLLCPLLPEWPVDAVGSWRGCRCRSQAAAK